MDGCRHVRIGECNFRTGDDCVVMRANRAEGKTLVCEAIVVEDCEIDATWHALCFYAEPGVKARAFGNVIFRNLRVRSGHPLMFRGTASAPLRNLRFERVTGIVDDTHPFDMYGVEGLSFKDVEITAGKGEDVPFERPPVKSWEAKRWPAAVQTK